MRKLKFSDMLEDFLESNANSLYDAFETLHIYEYIPDRDWNRFRKIADNIYRVNGVWYNYTNNKPVYQEDETGKFVKVGRLSCIR